MFWIMSIFMIGVILLSVLGSVVSFFKPEPDTGLQKVLCCFSFTNNFKKLVSTTDENTLRSLNGIWVLAMTLVVIGHSYSSCLISAAHNLLFFMDLFWAPLIAIIVNGTFAVDTFFFLSGLLTFYVLTQKLFPTNGRGFYLMFYVHRYLWLFPILFFMTIFGIFIYPYIGSGANWTTVKSYFSKNCSWYWWSNFLFINNIVPWSENDECMAWVWYLANDMQFFLVSPFIIFAYCKSWKLGYSILTTAIIATCVIPFVLSMVYKIPATISLDQSEGAKQQEKLIYTKPWSRFSTYGIGGIFGLMLFEHLKK